MAKFRHFPDKSSLLQFADSQIFRPRLHALLNDVFLCCLPVSFNPPSPHIRYNELPFRYPAGLPPEYLPKQFDVPQEFMDSVLSGIQMATFPAAAACFSTLELLAGFWIGRFNKHGIDYEAVERYAKRFMGYNPVKVRLAIKLYRHKISHTSMPANHILYPDKPLSTTQDGRRMRFAPHRRFTWEINFGGTRQHLRINRFVASNVRMERKTKASLPHYTLNLNPGVFVSDIFRSVYQKGTGYHTMLEKDSGKAQKKFDKAIGELFS